MLEFGVDVPLIIASRHSDEVGSSVSEFRSIAEESGIPFLYTNNLHKDETIDRFRSIEADIAVVLLWPQTLNDRIISTTRHGFVNVHGGDLPRYRGNACGNWAILTGESEFAVCVHLMEPGSLDSGPILDKSPIQLNDETTIGELTQEIEDQGVAGLKRAIQKMAGGDFDGSSQEGDGFRCYPRIASDGEIDWTQSAEQISRHIRSVSEPYPGAYCFYRGDKLIVWKASAVAEADDHMAVPGHVIQRPTDGSTRVAAGGGTVVELKEVQLEGQSRCPAGDVIKSIRVHLGMDHSSEILKLREQIEELKALVISLYPNNQQLK
jgi:methionyl-tRNA formyltransferase